MLDAIEFGHECCKKIIAGIRELVTQGRQDRSAIYTPPAVDQALYDKIDAQVRADLTDALNTKKYEKLESYARIAELQEERCEALPEEQQRRRRASSSTRLKERIFRDEMLKNAAPSGRPRVRRGPQDHDRSRRAAAHPRFGAVHARRNAGAGHRDARHQGRRAAHRAARHRARPPSASCCTTTSRRSASAKSGFMRGAGRREIGHGALAERALQPRDSGREDVPLHACAWSATFWNRTVRARWRRSAARSLALMDAGVPITAPVAGIAMGLVKEGDKYAILTDIAGAEDHYGDMDFKVAGTRDGITALQMDIKVAERHARASCGGAGAGAQGAPAHPRQDGRGASTTPRARSVAVRSAHLHACTIPTDKIRELIGPGGKVIRGIVEADRREDRRRGRRHGEHLRRRRSVGRTGASRWSPTSPRWPKSARPIWARWSGSSISARSSRSSRAPTACCTSREIAENRVKQVRDELKEGDQILVKVLALEGNKIKLSRKAVLKEQREKLKTGVGAGKAE